MADNTTLSPGVGGDTIREVDKAGIKTQVVLLDIGGIGAEALFAGAVSVSNFPASQAVTGTFFQATQPVSGSLTIASGTISLPSGASTSALQTIGNSSLSSIDTKTPSLGQALAAASVPVVLTAAQLSIITPLSSISISASALPVNAAIETGGNLATLAAKDFATQTTLAATSAAIGAEDDAALRADDDGTLSARLRGISEQIGELIGVQKETQLMFLQMLFALRAISSNNQYEVQ